LALIVGVTVPLFRAPRALVVCTSRLPNALPGEDVLALGIDMGMNEADVTAFIWTTGGTVALLDLRTGKLLGQERPAPPPASASGGSARSIRSAAAAIRCSGPTARCPLVEIAPAAPKKASAARFSRRRYGGAGAGM